MILGTLQVHLFCPRYGEVLEHAVVTAWLSTTIKACRKDDVSSSGLGFYKGKCCLLFCVAEDVFFNPLLLPYLPGRGIV